MSSRERSRSRSRDGHRDRHKRSERPPASDGRRSSRDRYRSRSRSRDKEREGAGRRSGGDQFRRGDRDSRDRSGDRGDGRRAGRAEQERNDRARPADRRREERPAPSVSDAAAVWGSPGTEEDDKKEPVAVVAKANFGVTGALAKDKATGNIYNGVVLKWSEPQDAAAPDKKWRLYVFQGDTLADTLHIHRQSAYLLGREEKVADIKLMNPSCSKQHAVIQFRRTATVVREATQTDEAVVRKAVKPYILDLESTNKTFLNGTAIEGSRYIELKPKDLLKFGESSKEYVLICEN